MAAETTSFFGWNMRLKRIGIGFPIVTGEAEGGRIALEQCPVWRRVAAMAAQTLTFANRFVYTLNTSHPLSLLMAVQTDFSWRISQHACILASMHIVTSLAVALLDRIMLRRVRDIVMTGQTESAFN